MGKTFKEQFYEALKDGKEDKAIFLTQFMKNEINELYDYRSPLFWASRYGNEKVAQALREMGAVEEVDKEGMSEELLKILDAGVIDKNDEKRAIELIKDGVNIEKKDKFGYTALMMASMYGNVEVVEALLSRGAKVDEKNDSGYTALIWASANDHVEIVKALLDAGAKVNEKNDTGYTALMTASANDYVEVVKTLLDAGAKVDEKNDKGYTALIWASIHADVEVVKTLLSRGAKVDEKDKFGGTALMRASERGDVEVVKLLLNNGADVTITKDDGKTAIDYTRDDEIKKLLNEAMRKQKVQKFKNKISALFGRE